MWFHLISFDFDTFLLYFYQASAYSACIAWYYFTISVCLSVRPVLALCLNELTYRHTFLTLIILVFFSHTAVTKFQGKPPQREVGKFCKYCHFSWKLYKIAHSHYGTLIESHRWPIDRCRFQWPWFDLERQEVRDQNFLADFHYWMAPWKNVTSHYISFPPITQWCSVSDVLLTGGRGVSDFSVLKYY